MVDTRDLKSLGVRAVPVQVRPGAPSIKVYVLTDVANAILAQLVERNLAKVEVIGSNPMYRSNFFVRIDIGNRVIILNGSDQKRETSGRGMEQFGSSSGS